MLYTTTQIVKGEVAVSKNELDNYVKKNDAVRRDEFNSLISTVANKLEKEPIHNHDIKDIKELGNKLNNKLDSNRQYAYQTLISNTNEIERLDKLNTSLIRIGEFTFSTNDEGLKIKRNDEIIAVFNNSWIIKTDEGMIDINKFIHDVKDNFENHKLAIEEIIK